MEETLAKEAIRLLENNRELLIILTIVFGAMLLIAFGAAAYLFVRLRSNLNMIERYHQIFRLQDVEDYVSLVRKKADLQAQEEQESKLSDIKKDLKQVADLHNKRLDDYAILNDDISGIIPRLVVAIPPGFRKAAIESAWKGVKSETAKSFLSLLRRDEYLKLLVPLRIGEDGEMMIYSHAPMPGEQKE